MDSLVSQDYMMRLEAILRKHRGLDDMEYVLSNPVPALYREINIYNKELAAILQELANSKKAGAVIKSSVLAFIEAVARYEKLSARKAVADEKKLLEGVIENYRSFYSQIASFVTDNQKRRVSNFRLKAEIAKLPALEAERVGGFTIRTRSGKKESYGFEDLKSAWDSTVKQYGNHAQIQYGWRTGNVSNQPIQSWVRMREITTAQDIDRLAMQSLAAQNKIYTFRINKNATVDSCQFWQGKIGFYTAAGKEEFLRLFPNHPEARDWPTMDYLVNVDKTHMFKWNCTHRAMPYPIQYFPEKERQSAIVGNTMPTIPEKINERELEEGGRRQGLSVGVQ